MIKQSHLPYSLICPDQQGRLISSGVKGVTDMVPCYLQKFQGLTWRCIQHIFMHPCLDKGKPGPFTTSAPLIPTYMSPWAALLKCWKGHRNMALLRICSLSDWAFEFHMHQWVISFVPFLWVIRNKIQRDSVWPPLVVTTFTFHSEAFYFLWGLIHC